MARELSPKTRAELESTGVALSGYIDSEKKQRYWTPDGEEVLAAPAMRDWIKKKDGKIVDSGTRDANLDKGWLLQPPTKPKLPCQHCSSWHDTREEIEACGAKKKAFDAKWAARAKKMKGGEDGDLKTEVSELKSDMVEIKKMLMSFLYKEQGET